MSDTLQVEVDGEIEDSQISGLGGGSPRWGFPAAVGVAGVLLMAVLVVVVLPAVTGGRAAAPGRGGHGRPAPQVGSAVFEKRAVSADPRIVATRSAMAAWGAFATTGRVGELRPWFSTDGPQYRLLQQEASGLSTQEWGKSAYTVEVNDPTVVASNRTEAVVAATVVWSQSGESSQQYRWELVLRPRDHGRWVLWTVRDAPS